MRTLADGEHEHALVMGAREVGPQESPRTAISQAIAVTQTGTPAQDAARRLPAPGSEMGVPQLPPPPYTLTP